ncbi:hypothetical protein HC231_21290 [Brenneria izadpanahii]|uniref:Uncharacterized protein n=1 Tax=Brenneria izadpanahii TaxID=2722756 RepID=A0ABX7URU1_9GAMM|nr:hypothetical protein [Brenneria izadpanahii]QTF06484.1 hypothetical protein HC231_21290 [Brenneria izadpanahii]
MRKKPSFPLELASSARIISDNLPGGVMRCCIKKSAVYGYQPQLPSGSRQAFSFPLLVLSLIKKPLVEGLFFVASHPWRPPFRPSLCGVKNFSWKFFACHLLRISVYLASNRWEKI